MEHYEPVRVLESQDTSQFCLLCDNNLRELRVNEPADFQSACDVTNYPVLIGKWDPGIVKNRISHSRYTESESEISLRVHSVSVCYDPTKYGYGTGLYNQNQNQIYEIPDEEGLFAVL